MDEGNLGRVVVFYLLRVDSEWCSNFSRFWKSYTIFESSMQHDLVVGIKGPKDLSRAIAQAEHHVASKGICWVSLPDSGFDLGAYARISRRFPDRYICYLNTHSEIAADNWLLNLMKPMQIDPNAISCCTASYSSLHDDRLTPIKFDSCIIKAGFRRIYEFLKIKTYRASPNNFPRFPNPHFRTNAFLANSNFLIGYFNNYCLPKNKRDCHEIESGSYSLTKFAERREIMIVIVNRKGRMYPLSESKIAGVFRDPYQELVTIKDNQTRLFSSKNMSEKIRLRWKTWGN